MTRWLHFTSLAVLFGAPVFWLLVAQSVPRSTAARALMRVAGSVAALSGGGWAVASIASIAGDPAGILDREMLHAFFLETPFGPIVAVRLALLVMVVAIAFAPMPNRPRLAIVAVLASVLLVSQGWLGHAASDGDTPKGCAMIAAYGCHVLAGAAWVGGLPPLFLLLRETRGLDDDAVWRVLRRVSTLATGAVALLAAAGVANALFRLGHFDDLWTTPYGTILLAKLAFTAAMLILAACNRIIIATRRGRAWLRPSVALELGLGVAVLGAAALLGVTPPPH